MPPGIFVRFLATNWCSLVDSGGCLGVNFQLCGHGGGFLKTRPVGGGGFKRVARPPPPQRAWF